MISDEFHPGERKSLFKNSMNMAHPKGILSNHIRPACHPFRHTPAPVAILGKAVSVKNISPQRRPP
jgi:hypothetical protein